MKRKKRKKVKKKRKSYRIDSDSSSCSDSDFTSTSSEDENSSDDSSSSSSDDNRRSRKRKWVPKPKRKKKAPKKKKRLPIKKPVKPITLSSSSDSDVKFIKIINKPKKKKRTLKTTLSQSSSSQGKISSKLSSTKKKKRKKKKNLQEPKFDFYRIPKKYQQSQEKKKKKKKKKKKRNAPSLSSQSFRINTFKNTSYVSNKNKLIEEKCMTIIFKELFKLKTFKLLHEWIRKSKSHTNNCNILLLCTYPGIYVRRIILNMCKTLHIDVKEMQDSYNLNHSFYENHNDNEITISRSNRFEDLENFLHQNEYKNKLTCMINNPNLDSVDFTSKNLLQTRKIIERKNNHSRKKSKLLLINELPYTFNQKKNWDKLNEILEKTLNEYVDLNIKKKSYEKNIYKNSSLQKNIIQKNLKKLPIIIIHRLYNQNTLESSLHQSFTPLFYRNIYRIILSVPSEKKIAKILTQLRRKSRIRISEEDIEKISINAFGNLSQAIQQFQFYGNKIDKIKRQEYNEIKQKKLNKIKKLLGENVNYFVKKKGKDQSATKDRSLTMYHAVNKMLFAKRNEENELEFDINDLFSRIHTNQSKVVSYLHENFIDHCDDINDIAMISECFSYSDMYMNEYELFRNKNIPYSFLISSHAVTYLNQHRTRNTFRQVRSPKSTMIEISNIRNKNNAINAFEDIAMKNGILPLHDLFIDFIPFFYTIRLEFNFNYCFNNAQKRFLNMDYEEYIYINMRRKGLYNKRKNKLQNNSQNKFMTNIIRKNKDESDEEQYIDEDIEDFSDE